MASELRVDKIIPTTGAPTGGGGGIIQVKQTVDSTANQQITGTTYADAGSLNVSITPK